MIRKTTRASGPTSEFVDAEQPPLTFPIPPTLEGTAAATATPTTQPMSLPTESTTELTATNTIDNHYQLQVLSDIKTTIDKKPLNDEDVE